MILVESVAQRGCRGIIGTILEEPNTDDVEIAHGTKLTREPSDLIDQTVDPQAIKERTQETERGAEPTRRATYLMNGMLIMGIGGRIKKQKGVDLSRETLPDDAADRPST